MFGHQDDVIAQDQKRDADVTIPESALDALTGPPDSGSTSPPSVATTDTTSNDSASTPDENTDTPNLAPTSVAGFTAPNTKLTTPFSYMQNNTSDDADEPQTNNTDADAEAPEEIGQQPVNALFSENEPDHDDEKAAADYLDNLIANNPHPDSDADTQKP